MARVPMQTIFDTLRARTPDDQSAFVLIAEALDALQLPTQDDYSPQEVVAIGTYLLGTMTKELEKAAPDLTPEAQRAIAALKPSTDLLKEELRALANE